MTQVVDVLVIGSGSAGMSAALRALDGGLKVMVVEKTAFLGGTSAMSGAGIWIPANHVARARGIADSPQEALDYLRAASPEGWQAEEDALWEAFATHAPDALAFIEANSPIVFDHVDEPDAMAELPGGKKTGRMVSPRALSRNLLGPLEPHLRRSTVPHWITYGEQVDYDPYHHPIRFFLHRWPRLLYRFLTNRRGQGSALMGGLIRACQDRGCEFLLEARARGLIVDEDGRVAGARIEKDGAVREIRARGGVVLATGGFEWDETMRRRYFGDAIDRFGSPRANEGDGQKMADEVGARLDRMDQANIFPCLPTLYEGKPHGLPMTFQTEQHSMIVDGSGRRFVSETNFNIGEVMNRRDPETGALLHAPVWLVGDVRFFRASMPFRWYARKEPGWVRKAGTLDALARLIDVPAAELKASVARFNEMSDRGRDDDFQRGRSAFEDYKSHGATNPLGRIDKAPFYAMSFNRSILGTKGGARTNARGQVLRGDGTVIPGLYAAGLAMANPIGTRAVGAGTTLGPNMTWGYICANTIRDEQAAAPR